MLQQLETMPVQRVETLERLSGLGKQQAAIGQHTVHIKKRDDESLRLEQQRAGAQSGVQGFIRSPWRASGRCC
jgi:hypothetical protein